MKVYLDDVEQLSGWSVDATTGLVTFSTPPALGVEVTADFDFDVPVRFDTDHMAVTDDTRHQLAKRVVEHLELAGFEIDEQAQVIRKRPPTHGHGD